LAGRGLIETAIGELKEICQIQHTTAPLAKQFLGRPLLGALGLCLQPNISHWKKQAHGPTPYVKLRLHI
ncbi:MAG: transposase, partial [Candidatus Midichloria mitochondrii]|nr:transposase [Candidatus Midichloria mitochondrii]